MERIIDLDVQVLSTAPAKVLITWEFLPGKRRQEYTVEILRGEREVDFQSLAIIDGSDLSKYIDYSANLIDTQKSYIYSANVKEKSTGKTDRQEETSWFGELDHEAIYVAEEQEFLHQDAIGMPTFVYLRKHDGAYCGECWDKVSKKRIKSYCLTCFNTNFTGGYYSPILKYIDFSPDNKSKIVTQLGEMQPGEVACTVGPFPIIKPGDIILDIINSDRYLVKRVNLAEKRQIPLLQALSVETIPKSDVTHAIPVDEALLTLDQKAFDKLKAKRGF